MLTFSTPDVYRLFKSKLKQMRGTTIVLSNGRHDVGTAEVTPLFDEQAVISAGTFLPQHITGIEIFVRDIRTNASMKSTVTQDISRDELLANIGYLYALCTQLG